MQDASGLAKDEIRRAALARRDAMPVERRVEASFAIGRVLERFWPPGDFTVAGGYLPIRSEADPRPAMNAAAERGLRLAVPAIIGDDLEFRALEGAGELVPQRHGTLAPGEEVERLRPDLLLVPLAAFDARLHRIGYGGGFYDRATAALKADGGPLLTVGIAFSAQQIGHVPHEPFDMPLDLVITESGPVYPSR